MMFWHFEKKYFEYVYLKAESPKLVNSYTDPCVFPRPFNILIFEFKSIKNIKTTLVRFKIL